MYQSYTSEILKRATKIIRYGKRATKIIRYGKSVSCLESLISKDEFLKITNGRARSWKLCLLKNKYENFSIRSKIRQMINWLLVYFPNFVNNICTKSNFQVKDLCHKFLENYIIGNCELLSKFNNN